MTSPAGTLTEAMMVEAMSIKRAQDCLIEIRILKLHEAFGAEFRLTPEAYCLVAQIVVRGDLDNLLTSMMSTVFNPLPDSRRRAYLQRIATNGHINSRTKAVAAYRLAHP